MDFSESSASIQKLEYVLSVTIEYNKDSELGISHNSHLLHVDNGEFHETPTSYDYEFSDTSIKWMIEDYLKLCTIKKSHIAPEAAILLGVESDSYPIREIDFIRMVSSTMAFKLNDLFR